MKKERIIFYEDLFKQYIMTCLENQHAKPMKQYMIELIEENMDEYKVINYAFLAVKKELVG